MPTGVRGSTRGRRPQTEPDSDVERPVGVLKRRSVRWSPAAVVLTAALVATGCSGGGAAPPSPSPTPPSISHPAGATNLVLRVERGGGLVPIEFLASQAPSFSLFGNGVVVFQRPVGAGGGADAGGLTHGVPWRTATLDEGRIQELLAFALGPGGLGSARATYPAVGVMDAPDTIFTIHAGAIDKVVVVNALGLDPQVGADAAARASFQRLADRLFDFEATTPISTAAFVPALYRATLTDRDAPSAGTARPWPWPAIGPSDFTSAAADGSGGARLSHRTFRASEVAVLGLTGIEGGIQGLALVGPAPDTRTYALALRPLLPDEPA